MLKKYKYKLWKHLNKEFGTNFSPIYSSNRDNNNISSKLDFLLNETVNLRRFLMLKEVCPELIEKLTTKISIPLNERGIDYYAYFKHRHNSILSWLDEATAEVNTTKAEYQSSETILKEYIDETLFLLSQKLISTPVLIDRLIETIYNTADSLNNAKQITDSIIQSEWMNNKLHPHTWMRIISFYLSRNDEATSLKLLEKYQTYWKKRDISQWLAVADILYRNGEQSYKKEADVFQRVMKNTKDRLFHNSLMNKKVALIGNGPQEIGKGMGKHIDEYDIVIRMNDYKLTSDYIKDYGQKVDIRYRFIGENIDYSKYQGAPKISITGCPFYTYPYRSEIIDLYEKQLDEGQIICALDLKDHHEICKNLNVIYPSGGLIMLYLIKSLNPMFSEDDCFGFSFKTGEDIWTHSDNSLIRLPVHNLVLEKEIIGKLFGGSP